MASPTTTDSPSAPTFGSKVQHKAKELQVLVQAGVLAPARPDKVARQLKGLISYGPTPAGAYAAASGRVPERVALIDERRSVTYGEMDARVKRIAAGLAQLGVTPGSSVGLFARNSATFVESLVAISRLGADALLLNTFLSPAQVAEVLEREKPPVVISDAELLPALAEAPAAVVVLAEPADGDVAPGGPVPKVSIDDLAHGTAPDPAPTKIRGKIVVLTSGTTGAPKGARRPAPKGLGPAASMFSRLKMKAHSTVMIAPPLFHTWGLGVLQLTPALRATLVLRRKADPETLLEAISTHQANTLVVVPVMLQRLLEVPEDKRKAYDLSSLSIVAASGSALSAHLGTTFMDAFGDVLHNIYGSTEVSWAAIADPEDLRAAPGTAGQAPLGTVLAILDEEGNPLPSGEVGRIFVGNEMTFEGYTNGADKERTGDLVSTGDLGLIDKHGRLQVLGRDDDMIISGGENVFPSSVEELLISLPEINEVAVVGVADEQMGQRLAAYVVVEPGATLTEDDVKSIVKEKLAKFSVPRDVVFLEALPRNPTGKVVPRLLPPSR